MILSKCAIYGSKKSKFIKKQEAKRLLSNPGIRTPLSKIPLLGDILFQLYKMNGIIYKFLFTVDKFMPDTNYIYKNALDKACFADNAKDIKSRTAAYKVLRDKAYEIAKDPKHYGSQRGLAKLVYQCFDKKASGRGVKSIPQNEQLSDELHKPIIRKFFKKVYSGFKDNVWAADLADMQLISSFNKGFRFLLYVIDIYSKYAWVVSLKDKKGVSIVNVFQSILKKI